MGPSGGDGKIGLGDGNGEIGREGGGGGGGGGAWPCEFFSAHESSRFFVVLL
jgi:hypothetical protein